MRTALVLSLAVTALSACGSSRATTAVPSGSPSSVSTAPADRGNTNANARGRGRGQPARGPRKLNGVPKGHYPKPGECRIWHSGRPPGQQPKPTACSSLMGRVPAGAFILYGDQAYDSQYDYAPQAQRDGASVPKVILDILRSMNRR